MDWFLDLSASLTEHQHLEEQDRMLPGYDPDVCLGDTGQFMVAWGGTCENHV